jgi:hypothetical protein
VVSLWTSGTFTRCPSVRFILPHAGGDVPYIATPVDTQLADCLGTDYPFGALGTAERTARELEDLNLGARLVEAIGRGNALGLFPRLR